MGNRRVPFRGESGLEIWEKHPKREEYRAANGGMGMCNTGSGRPYNCCLGGNGCDADHALIATENLLKARYG